MSYDIVEFDDFMGSVYSIYGTNADDLSRLDFIGHVDRDGNFLIDPRYVSYKNIVFCKNALNLFYFVNICDVKKTELSDFIASVFNYIVGKSIDKMDEILDKKVSKSEDGGQDITSFCKKFI